MIEITFDAYIPGEYVEDAMHKIELYQQIAAIRTEEQASELMDEVIDRFGDPPAAFNNLMAVAKIKNIARKMGVKAVLQKADWLEISFTDKPDVNVQGIMTLRAKSPSRVKIEAGPPQRICIRQAAAGGGSDAEWLLAVFRKLEPQQSP